MESVAVSAPETQPTCKMVIGLCATFHKVFEIRKPSKRLQRGKLRMVAFAVSIIATVILVWGFYAYLKRCPIDKEFTWGEAMLFATYVFFILFWVYGVVPHQWLTWADSELNWRPDRFIVGPELPWTGEQGIVEWALPFTMTYLVIRDVIAVVIYGIALAGNVVCWRHWQNRGVEKEEVEDTSEYGRPLIKEGVGI